MFNITYHGSMFRLNFFFPEKITKQNMLPYNVFLHCCYHLLYQDCIIQMISIYRSFLKLHVECIYRSWASDKLSSFMNFIWRNYIFRVLYMDYLYRSWNLKKDCLHCSWTLHVYNIHDIYMECLNRSWTLHRLSTSFMKFK